MLTFFPHFTGHIDYLAKREAEIAQKMEDDWANGSCRGESCPKACHVRYSHCPVRDSVSAGYRPVHLCARFLTKGLDASRVGYSLQT